MSASKKLIRDCSECMKELRNLINSCKEWEIKKKEILEQIENKTCSVKPNKSHWAVVQEEMNKLYQACPKNPNGSHGEVWRCNKCNIGGSWRTNGFGDFQVEGSYCEHEKPNSKEYLEKQGINIPKVGEHASNQIKSNQIKSNQIKSNQIKSNQIKSNQIKSNQIKSNQIKSNQIKSNIEQYKYPR